MASIHSVLHCAKTLFGKGLGGATALAVMIALSLSGPAAAQQKSERAYVFGNSLINHATDSDETTVPHWMALMAREAGHQFRLSGQWGFIRDFTRSFPPQPNWSFRRVRNAWFNERSSFGRANLTNVWVNPANFIQFNSVDTPYDGENPTNISPLAATAELLTWVAIEAPDVGMYIYEGWPEMNSITRSFPPTQSALANYHQHAMGDYAVWFDDYVASLRAALPGQDVNLIPVSRVLSRVMTETALSELPALTFYSDDAPHGTAALYLMAAMVTYNTIYDEPVPDAFRPPSSIAPELRATFPIVRDAIWQAVQEWKANAPEGNVFSTGPVSAPQQQAPAEFAEEEGEGAEGQVPPNRFPAQPTSYDEQLSNPPLAMGLNGISDWSTQHPFLDMMKSARPWIGHSNDQWGAFENEDIVKAGLLDDLGWPLALPEGARAIEAIIMTDQTEEATHLAGRYVLRYDGKGTLDVTGRAQVVSRKDGEIVFDYQPGEGLVAIVIVNTDPNDHLRNISIVREDYLALYESGARFNPLWLAKIENVRSLRFMDWMSTNGSVSSTWDRRPTVDHYSYVPLGVPAEVMIDLVNLIGADPWFNMPHMADDDYLRQFAQLVKDTLNPELKVYVEYSNEVWNFVFPQAHYAAEQARIRWRRKAGDDAWMQFYGMRSAQMAQIWTEVFGEDRADQLIPVIATHTGWIGLEESALNAQLWQDESADNWPPYVYFKAYAVTGYFGFEMGNEEGAPDVLDWLAQSADTARQNGQGRGLSGRQLDAFVEENKYEAANKLVDAGLREGSFGELVNEIFPTHAKIADEHGLTLVMYEGGTHVSVSGEFSRSDTLIEFFKQFNYSEEMSGLYRDLLIGWKAAGGTIFNAFVDVSFPSQYGSWGALRHLQDDNPRWTALMNFNAGNEAWWEARDPNAFTGGRVLYGSAETDELNGTPKADLMDGAGGDDVFIPGGGIDKLIGGDGFDAVLLAGGPADYGFRRDEGHLIILGESGEVHLDGVEMLWFEAEEDLAIMTEDLR